ncbi:MAG: hypothetical protein LBI79_10575 [Nitrososphaerota archaeon]|jgi:hypothetical protein|nr:hypothetical protein [Nitrososphaerota archaeon]
MSSNCYVDEPCMLKACCPCGRFLTLPLEIQRRRRLSHVMRTRNIIVTLDVETHIVTAEELPRQRRAQQRKSQQ